MNTKMKLSTSIFVVSIALFGLFAIATPASAMTCNSATLTGTVDTGTPPTQAWFEYSTNQNGGWTPTATQYFSTEGNSLPIEQFVSGLSANTSYYYRLVVSNNYGTKNLNIENFTTPSCYTPVQTCQDTTATNYGGTLPCVYQTVCRDTTATNYGGTLPCVYQTYNYTCRDTSATNYGGTLPCVYQTYNYTCRDTSATNYGGTLPCVYQTYNYTCRDTSATNYGGTLPCVYYSVQQSTLTVVTTQATNVANTSAQLNSLIGSSGNTSVNGWFEWGRTINLGNTTTIAAVGALSSVIHSDTLSGLNAGTTYYFRAVAQGSSQKSNGAILSFTTTGEQPVIVYHPTSNPTSLVLITSSVDRNQAIVPTLDNTRPHPGDEINYTINYQNAGTGAVTNLTLQATLPGEVDYLSSTPINPTVSGNTLVFNLGTLRANSNGVVTIKVRVQDTAPAGTNLDFPATLSYINPSGQSQSTNTTVSAQVYSSTASSLGAFVFGSGFFPENMFGWLLLIILILILALLARYLYKKNDQTFGKKTTTVVNNQPSLGKKITTTTVEE